MRHTLRLVVAATVAVALAGPAPVQALDLGGTVKKVTRTVKKTVSGVTGGGESGGTSTASTSGSSGDTSGGVSGSGAGTKLGFKTPTLGGTELSVGLLDDDAAVSAGISGGGNTIGAKVLSNYQLATLGLDSNPPGTGNVALPSGAVAGVTGAYAASLHASLNSREKQELRIKCASVLRSPKAFDAELILLCRLLAKL